MAIKLVTLCKWLDDDWPEDVTLNTFSSEIEMADYIKENTLPDNITECSCRSSDLEQVVTSNEILNHIREHGHYFAHPFQYFLLENDKYFGPGDYE
uniref:Uncharacterized protein n=1 Tax=Marseillevirus LCMAC202 TaxID=2506606 RepID=A0A481YZS6_9VIRU|nr:MAG: hypothetical protein LCMAC202_03270 [Marseillevirus LCMAC202]